MDDIMLGVRVIVALAAVSGLIWYLQRRLTRGQKQRSVKDTITLVGRKPLGGKAALVVVEAEGKRYVLGVAENHITVVDTIATCGEDAVSDDGAHTGTMPTTSSPLLPATGDDFSSTLARVSSGAVTPVGASRSTPFDLSVLARHAGLTRRGTSA